MLFISHVLISGSLHCDKINNKKRKVHEIEFGRHFSKEYVAENARAFKRIRFVRKPLKRRKQYRYRCYLGEA